MSPHWIFSAIVVMAGSGIAQGSDDFLKARLERAASMTGTDYLVARKELVATESNAVVTLTAISTNVLESWQIRLMAGIVAERISKGTEIDEFVQYNWRQDPRYGSDWDKYHGGPVKQLMPLVIERCIEKGLWWHYMEVVWKETREHSMRPRIREDYWRGTYEMACRRSSVYGLILKVAEDRIRRDINFRNWETRGDLAFLENSRTNTVLPFLLEIADSVPVADTRDRPVRITKWITTLATTEDVPMIEEFYKKRGEQVPASVAPRLKELNECNRARPSSK